ncbi:hypothetical protein NECID01_0430 [Nematocida sp. AWRm77]|nr:hypothetical protein NECID01_0430 [Nematocida sp. AWRm77]
MYTFSNSLLASPGKKCVFGEIKEGLESGEKKSILEALHVVSRNRLNSRQKALIFPQVVSMVLHPCLEIKCAAYSFVLRTIEIDKTLLLLVVNTVLQEMRACGERASPSHALRKALAIDFVSKVRDKEFLGHFYDEVEESLRSSSEIVKKSALLAQPALFRVFGEADFSGIKSALLEKRAGVLGCAVFAVCAIERERKGQFEEEYLVLALRSLCGMRAEVEEAGENFGVLFSHLCRALRPFPKKEILDSLIVVVPFLPLYAVREVILSSGEFLTPSVAERVGLSLCTYLGTEQKSEALELILLLLNSSSVKLPAEPFFVAGSDGKKEKVLKLQILAFMREESAVAEIRTFLRDRECTFQALCLLISLNLVQEEDLKAGFKYSPSSTLKALYVQHPLPAALSHVVTSALLSLSNVSEKEAYLFLAGYYLSTIPDEAKRIRRIRNSAGGILYGRKEEREKSEEHLEEYLYFLLNLYTRSVLTKEECIKHAGDAFLEEPFLLNKFNHLITLPDQKYLLELIAYKRISYKITGVLH